MKALKIILYIIVILIGLVAVLGIIAPKAYHVERSMTIAAAPDVVFENVKYWNKWQGWLPWAKDDSTMKISYTGIDGTVGSGYSWVGDKSGSGEMSTTALKANEEITYHLKFITPYESHADGYVRLAAGAGGTRVTWAMYGEDRFPWNIMMLFMNMDKMIGPDFERGLTMLKEIAEKEEAKIAGYEIIAVDLPGRTFAAIRQEVKFADIQTFFTNSIGRLMGAAGEKGARVTGAPCGLFYTWDETAQSTGMAAAVPIAAARQLGTGIEVITTPKGKAFLIDYYGPFEQSVYAYKAMDRYFAKQGLKQAAPIIEEYLTDPSLEPDQSKWLTKIYFFAE